MNKDMVLDTSDETEQDPTVQLWLYYFISHHYLFQRDLSKAFEYVNKAIEHTPTLLELYTLKGKIYEKAGNAKRASELFEEARQLDLADRAINAISAIYHAKADDIDKAEETINLFFSECGYKVTVHDNQTLWFEVCIGNSALRQDKLQKAMKEFHWVEKNVETMIQD